LESLVTRREVWGKQEQQQEKGRGGSVREVSRCRKEAVVARVKGSRKAAGADMSTYLVAAVNARVD
jgi:hypothetical protein